MKVIFNIATKWMYQNKSKHYNKKMVGKLKLKKHSTSEHFTGINDHSFCNKIQNGKLDIIGSSHVHRSSSLQSHYDWFYVLLPTSRYFAHLYKTLMMSCGLSCSAVEKLKMIVTRWENTDKSQPWLSSCDYFPLNLIHKTFVYTAWFRVIYRKYIFFCVGSSLALSHVERRTTDRISSDDLSAPPSSSSPTTLCFLCSLLAPSAQGGTQEPLRPERDGGEWGGASAHMF